MEKRKVESGKQEAESEIQMIKAQRQYRALCSEADSPSPHCASWRWRLLAFALSAFCFPISAFSASPTITTTVEPAEIRPGGFTTYIITIENAVPDASPELKLPKGLETTTSTPAFGKQVTIINGSVRQA